MGLLEEFGLPGMVRCVPVGLFITQRYYVHWVKTTPPRPATPISRFVVGQLNSLLGGMSFLFNLYLLPSDTVGIKRTII